MDISELTYKIYELIPVYPGELTAKQIALELGVSPTKVAEIIISSSCECLIGESEVRGSKRYTYIDEKAKSKTLNYIKNGGVNAVFENE